jgi:hypothetical protein
MANSNDELADLCLDHAWRDEIDDDTRWLLEKPATYQPSRPSLSAAESQIGGTRGTEGGIMDRPLIERDGFCLLVRERCFCTRDCKTHGMHS